MTHEVQITGSGGAMLLSGLATIYLGMGPVSTLLLIFVLAVPAALPAQEAAGNAAVQGNWEQDLAARHQKLVDENGPGTDAALREELLAMRERDREARGLSHAADGKRIAMAMNLGEIDAALTEELKKIVTAKGWPTIGLVGIDASNAAMLVLTHSADHEWQRTLLPELEGLADGGKIDGSALALVVDKELVASGRLQRYGTQFKVVKGAMAMLAVEDPSDLDRRRAQVLLAPMEIYKEQLAKLYHVKMSNQIVMAAQPVK